MRIEYCIGASLVLIKFWALLITTFSWACCVCLFEDIWKKQISLETLPGHITYCVRYANEVQNIYFSFLACYITPREMLKYNFYPTSMPIFYHNTSLNTDLWHKGISIIICQKSERKTEQQRRTGRLLRRTNTMDTITHFFPPHHPSRDHRLPGISRESTD